MCLRFLALAVLAVVPVTFAALPANFQTLSADAKRTLLLERINANPYSGVLPDQNPGALSMAQLFLPTFLVKSFTHQSDELGDAGRQKLIHTHGSVAPVSLNIFENSTYTGIFKAGLSSKALIRLSLAKHDLENYAPGMALKVLVDRHASLNIIAMFSLDGQGTNRNFLQNPFWNIIDHPTSIALKLLAKAFDLSLKLLPGGTLDRPEAENNLPLYEHASFDSQGNVPVNVRAPYRISFIPNPALGWSPSTPNDFRINLASIPTGSLLYTVAVNRELYLPSEIIGQLVMDGPFVASTYGDEQLFFQHHPKRWRP